MEYGNDIDDGAFDFKHYENTILDREKVGQ